MKTEIKALYKKDPRLAKKVAAALGYKIKVQGKVQNDGFFKQTARDYGISLHEVKKIDKRYPHLKNANKFYQALEDYLSEERETISV